MNILWVELLTLLLCHNQAFGHHFTEKDELGSTVCSSESCSPNLRPIPMVQAEKLNRKESDGSDAELEIADILRAYFNCDDKPYIPGLYADMETNCKFFHVCKETVVEHYMCLHGLVFDQQTLQCKPEGEVQCHLSSTYYVENTKLPPAEDISPRKIFYMDRFKWFYGLVEKALADDVNPVELNYINLLISLKLISTSDVPAGILDAESYGKEWEERADGFLNSDQLRSLTKKNLHTIFEHPPVVYGTDPRNVSEQPESTETRRRSARSPSNQESSKVQISFDVPEPNRRIAVNVIELIVNIVGAITDRILNSRTYLLSQYVQGIVRNVTITRS